MKQENEAPAMNRGFICFHGGNAMREFFRTTRRKIGVSLLILACLIAVAWVTSLSSPRQFIHPLDPKKSLSLRNGTVEVISGMIPREIELPGGIKATVMEAKVVGAFHLAWAAIPLTIASAYLLLWKRRSPNESQIRLTSN